MTVDHDGALALLVDSYELTMVDAYRREGMADRPATFSLFVRDLPPERGYLVAAGLDSALAWLEHLRFGDDEISALERVGSFDREFLDWLGALRFTGRVRAAPEGTIVFAHEPVLEVDAPIGQAQLAETYLLNQITMQTVLATTASRFRHAAGGQTLIDFALRRTPGTDAGMKLVRAGRIVGVDATSNVAGADRYGLPASGTMAHSFVQAYRSEIDAFRAFAAHQGDATVLLVDTYDTPQGVEHAIEVASECRARGVEIRGIRIDSGDLAALARGARRRLDDAGFPRMRIFVSGGLDEHRVARLVREDAPIDGFGVGTALGAPDRAALDTVYKLVAFDGRPVHKTSPGKTIWPGPKQIWRGASGDGDVLALADDAPLSHRRPLLRTVMDDGRRTPDGQDDLDAARAHFDTEWEWLPAGAKDLTAPSSVDVVPSGPLVALTERLDDEHARSG